MRLRMYGRPAEIWEDDVEWYAMKTRLAGKQKSSSKRRMRRHLKRKARAQAKMEIEIQEKEFYDCSKKTND